MTATHWTDLTTLLRNAIIPILLVMQAILMPTPVKAAEYLQCVPFARELSGIEIYGDAHSWWRQAAGKYQRGSTPAEGAILSLPGHGSMTLGHIAVVRKIVDRRNILISHANWSPINGRRGQIERRVIARDVSPANDWSAVRIWYAPIGKLGTTAYPVNGFIYPARITNNSGRHWVSNKVSPDLRKPEHPADDARENSNASEDLIGDLLDRLGS